MDPSSITTVAKGLTTAARVTKLVLDKLYQVGPTARLQEAMEIEHRSWRAARDAQIEARLASLEASSGDNAEFERRVAEMTADLQFARLHVNVEYEALREATDDRREMLAALAAGLADPSLPINLKARIERTVRGLDPIDIVALRAIVEDPEVGGPRVADTFPISFAALIASGCVLLVDGTWDDNAKPTALASEVLAVLSDYEFGESGSEHA